MGRKPRPAGTRRHRGQLAQHLRLARIAPRIGCRGGIDDNHAEVPEFATKMPDRSYMPPHRHPIEEAGPAAGPHAILMIAAHHHSTAPRQRAPLACEIRIPSVEAIAERLPAQPLRQPDRFSR